MSMSDAYTKPLPDITSDSAPYWEALRKHVLVLQRCTGCGRVRHYPRPMCSACHSMEYDWVRSSGRGRVHSWTVAHHAFHPGFKRDLPYVVALVDMEEGVRLNAPLRGVSSEAMRIGLPVRIIFEDATEDVTLPAFVQET
jgi:uncharacterized OB-fold protein